MSRRSWFQTLIVTLVTALLLTLSGTASAQGNSDNAFERVKEVQERHTAELMAKAGVVGTAVGLNDQGSNAVLILLERPAVGGIPQELEGVSVHPIVTGRIDAIKASGKPGGGGSKLTPTSYWPRPVPIGVSTGNALSNSAGTVSCRVKDGSGALYALSNNHVYALENSAPPNSEVLQPGRYDGGVPSTPSTVSKDHLGNLTTWVEIIFSETALNRVDAAIAATDEKLLGTTTPADGYGTPKSTTLAPAVRMAVQKYGRTTSLTKGTITGINATIKIGYSSGTAQFVGQIIVQSRSPFIKAGDSGSLLVTDPGKNPVGLLFAGNSSGNYAVANDIRDVLAALGHVAIDGQ